MDWVFDHLQILFLVAIAVVAILQRLKKTVAGEGAPRPASATPAEEERTRRIQEEIRRRIMERRGLAPLPPVAGAEEEERYPFPAAPPMIEAGTRARPGSGGGEDRGRTQAAAGNGRAGPPVGGGEAHPPGGGDAGARRNDCGRGARRPIAVGSAEPVRAAPRDRAARDSRSAGWAEISFAQEPKGSARSAGRNAYFARACR